MGLTIFEISFYVPQSRIFNFSEWFAICQVPGTFANVATRCDSAWQLWNNYPSLWINLASIWHVGRDLDGRAVAGF